MMKRHITMRLYIALLTKPGSYVWGKHGWRKSRAKKA